VGDIEEEREIIMKYVIVFHSKSIWGFELKLFSG
jgi:hypothetical protein